MRAFLNFILTVTLVILFCYSSSYADENQMTIDSSWNQDLDFIYQQVLSIHPDPFTKISKDTFDLNVQRLRNKLDQSTDDEIRTEIIRLVGMIGDGHTRLHGKQLSDRWFPLRIEKFKDGHFVTATSPDYQNLIGAKVTRIGRYESNRTFEMAGSVFSFDNQYSRDYYAPAVLTMVSIMNGLNISGSRDTIDLSIQFKGANTRDVQVIANEFESDQELAWYWLKDGVPSDSCIRFHDMAQNPLPLCYHNPDRNYWFEHLKEFDLVYMRFNVCKDDANESFDEFNKRMWNFIDTNNVKRLIIDLRNNMGGNSGILQPLIHGIIKRDLINRKGNIFAIIGGKTWSAAMHCASFLEEHTNLIFVGEPTGSAPNHFADPSISILPNSGMVLMVSRLYWQNAFPDDSREWISPDIQVSITSDDYFGLNDPVLDTILSLFQK